MNDELISVEELEKLGFKSHEESQYINGIDFAASLYMYKMLRSELGIRVYFNREFEDGTFTNNWNTNKICVTVPGNLVTIAKFTTMQQLANLVFLLTGHPICEHKKAVPSCKYCFGWDYYKDSPKLERMARFEYVYQYPERYVRCNTIAETIDKEVDQP